MKICKTLLVGIIVGIASVQNVSSQEWKLNEKESSVVFIAKNLGMKVMGKITGMKVIGKYNAKNIFTSSFTGSIDVSTIDTKIALRDNHLKSKDYFEVEKYPTITFTLSKITDAGSALKAIGDISIKGVTKEIEILFTVRKNGNQHTFLGNVTIQRKDFHLGGNTTLILADTIQVRIVSVFEETSSE